jgi:hypothetical protein
MTLHCRELDLKAMLADPIVKAVMEADGIDPRELEAGLPQIAARLRATWNTPKPGLASARRGGDEECGQLLIDLNQRTTGLVSVTINQGKGAR